MREATRYLWAGNHHIDDITPATNRPVLRNRNGTKMGQNDIDRIGLITVVVDFNKLKLNSFDLEAELQSLIDHLPFVINYINL